MVQLSIIILSYNTKQLVIECIHSLVKFYGKELAQRTYEIIIADNASTDDTVEKVQLLLSQLKEVSPSITIARNKENFGFSKGNNIAATKAKGKYLLFLNSDTQAVDDSLKRMVSFLDVSLSVGVVGAAMYNSDGSVQPSAGKFYTIFNATLMLLGFERFGFLRIKSKKVESVDWVSGGFMMISKELFNKISGFDERFFMYIEDMELCFRVKQLGLGVTYYPQSAILHVGHGSSNRSFAIVQIYIGLLYFYKKHKSSFAYSYIKSILVCKAVIAILIGTVFQNKQLVSTYKQALGHNL